MAKTDVVGRVRCSGWFGRAASSVPHLRPHHENDDQDDSEDYPPDDFPRHRRRVAALAPQFVCPALAVLDEYGLEVCRELRAPQLWHLVVAAAGQA